MYNQLTEELEVLFYLLLLYQVKNVLIASQILEIFDESGQLNVLGLVLSVLYKVIHLVLDVGGKASPD